MKKTLAIILILVMTLSVAACGKVEEVKPSESVEESKVEDEIKTYEKEIVITTLDPNSTEYPAEITIDGQTYKLIDSKEASREEKEVVAQVEQIEVVKETDVAKAKTITVNGHEYNADVLDGYKLSPKRIKQVKTASVSLSAISGNPDFPQTYDVEYEDKGEKIVAPAPFKELKRMSEYWWEPDFNASASFTGSKGCERFSLNESTELPYNEAAPVFAGYEDGILGYLGLSTDYYRITGSSWGEETENADGTITRTAVYSGDRLVCNWDAVYELEYETDGYAGDVVYFVDADSVNAPAEDRTTMYIIKAVTTYQLIETA